MTESTKKTQLNLPIPRCYQACRLSAQMRQGRLYTTDHYWMQQESPGVWRVGLTPWVVRMLGDLEEYRIDAAPGASTPLNQPLGALEGRNAVVKLRAAVTGTFLHRNPLLADNLEAIAQDCCNTGWLYLIQGSPDPETCDVKGYQVLLDESIEAVCSDGPQLQ